MQWAVASRTCLVGVSATVKEHGDNAVLSFLGCTEQGTVVVGPACDQHKREGQVHSRRPKERQGLCIVACSRKGSHSREA